MDGELSRVCWRMLTLKATRTGGVRMPSVDKNSGKLFATGYGICGWLWDRRCNQGTTRAGVGVTQRSNAGVRGVRPHHQKCMARGRGPPRKAEQRGVLGPRPLSTQENGTLRCPAGASLWLSEVRQETPFTQTCGLSGPTCRIASTCSYREQCLGPAAKSHRARRVSAVRHLLAGPSVATRTPVVVGSMRWVDVAGRALRRTWTAHWRRQYVEVLPLEEGKRRVAPPPRAPRSVRSHHRWSWQDRLAQNAWWGPPHLRVIVAGVPAVLECLER